MMKSCIFCFPPATVFTIEAWWSCCWLAFLNSRMCRTVCWKGWISTTSGLNWLETGCVGMTRQPHLRWRWLESALHDCAWSWCDTEDLTLADTWWHMGSQPPERFVGLWPPEGPEPSGDAGFRTILTKQVVDTNSSKSNRKMRDDYLFLFWIMLVTPKLTSKYSRPK